MILTLLVLCMAIMSILTLREPPQFTEVREKYRILRSNPPSEFPELKRRIILTGYTIPRSELGYNVNKGSEIGLCLDGDSNEIFHVLLHELAHSTVDEYTHSDEFWKNFEKLRDHSEKLGIYTPITKRKAFCGAHIKD